MDPNERSLQMRLASHVSWANTSDRKARTEAARKGFEARFEKEVDPEGVLPEAERKQRAASARKAHFARLALASVQARRIRKEQATTKKPGRTAA